MTPTPVYLEAGSKRVFAVMVDWPGWARSGRTAEAALEALTAYEPRYRPVADRAGHPLPDDVCADLTVVETVPGNATTDFGAPGKVPDVDRRPTDAADAGRLADLVEAAWAVLDETAAAAPPTLRKGPRGGGRDRDDVVRHVLAAERSYVRTLGVKLPEPQVGDTAAITAFRSAASEALRRPQEDDAGTSWPLRYAARRIAWHVLDHAWEIEDKAEP